MKQVHLVEHHGGIVRVQIARWFIGQQNPRLIQQGSSHRHPLPLSHAQLARPMMRALRKSELSDQCFGPGLCFGIGGSLRRQ